MGLLEKKETLTFKMVGHLPKWLSPNILSWTRLVLTIPTICLLFYEYYVAGIIIFLFAMILDAFDGSLARQRRQVSSFGKILDPTADKTLFLATLIVLGLRFLDFYTLSVIIVSEVISIVQALAAIPFLPLLKKWGLAKKLGSNWLGKIKALVQVLGIIFLIINIFLPQVLIVSQVLFWLGAILCFISCVFHQAIPTKDKNLLATKI